MRWVFRKDLQAADWFRGTIDEKTFLRGQRDAIEKRDKALEKPEPPKIGMLEKGSVAAYSQAKENEKSNRTNKLLEEIDGTLKRLETKNPSSGLKQI